MGGEINVWKGGHSMGSFLKKIVFMALCMTLTLSPTAWSQGKKAAKYPIKPIDLIVPFAPGGGVDMSARAFAPYAAKKFGVPVNIVNGTGASGVTGMLQALRAVPDGYTMLYDNNATNSMMFATRTDLPLKIEDRTLIARTMTDYWYFFCNNDTGWKTLEEALQFIRSRPEEFKWGAGAFGATPMFVQVDLFLAAGVTMDKIKKTRMVVFEKGNAASMQACITGDVQFAGGMAADVPKMLATGRVRVLATNGPERTKDHPEIPTTKELGYPKVDMASWFGIAGPKALPESIVKSWDDLVRGAMSDPEAQAAAAKAMKTWSYLPPQQFKAYVLKEYEKIVSAATALGIRK